MIQTPVAPSTPVFVDQSGRRGRVALVVGLGLGGAMVAGLAALAMGLVGAGPDEPPVLPGGGPRVPPAGVAPGAAAPSNA